MEDCQDDLESSGDQDHEAVQEESSTDEDSSDLETGNKTAPRPLLSQAERYLQDCQEIGVIPDASFLCNLGNTSLNLSHRGLGPLGVKALALVLEGDCILKELDLSNNRICWKGGEHLSWMLGHNFGIEVLNLSWNGLCLSGASALSTVVKVNSSLKELYLSHNSFGRAAAELGQALKQNDELLILDLCSNLIDDEAVALLCSGLATNTALKVLKLSQNPISKIGALTLLRTVTNNKNSAMKEIDISSVHVCETFVELLEKARQQDPALDVRYSVFDYVTMNVSAFNIFKKFTEEKHGSIMEFFQGLDDEKTMKVSNSVFRKAVKEANIPLNRHQLEWLIRKFDENFTATINYSQFC
ncbi:leucine-rich repeat-containing protein 74A-like [Cololabis saira]|uniref:leucine-rich repeat-containing protein 74A-like n=1 Tax=Cololabis saira TaxID=129043 RepID=UPI002AD5146F|nr:leucine-rich repeat-containing protein 74A-like [Cololabis saira]